jgi:hypothetical protein
MVARNADDHSKAHKAPTLVFDGEDNIEAARYYLITFLRLRYEIGMKNQESRKFQSSLSLSKRAP